MSQPAEHMNWKKLYEDTKFGIGFWLGFILCLIWGPCHQTKPPQILPSDMATIHGHGFRIGYADGYEDGRSRVPPRFTRPDDR